jgi:hypothetical protein
MRIDDRPGQTPGFESLIRINHIDTAKHYTMILHYYGHCPSLNLDAILTPSSSLPGNPYSAYAIFPQTVAIRPDIAVSGIWCTMLKETNPDGCA